jgi:phosphocarrier protein HPr
MFGEACGQERKIFSAGLNNPALQLSNSSIEKHVMKATRLTVKWEKGLHMRAAAQLVQVAQRFHSRILLRLGARVADARSILSVMILAASLGTVLDVEASGDDEQEAVQAVQSYFDNTSHGD